MYKSIAVVNSKGGSNKSTLVASMAHVLTNIYEKRVTVYSLDPQASVKDSVSENPEFLLIDTIGTFAQTTLDVLNSMKDDSNSLVIVPVSTGHSDKEQYDFVINKLREIGILDKTVFVFTKVRANSVSFAECKALLKDKNVNVAKSFIPQLECFAQWRFDTYECVKHTSKLLNEIVL